MGLQGTRIKKEIIFFTKNDHSFTKYFETDFDMLKEVGI